MNKYEQDYALMEAHRNQAWEEYWNARNSWTNIAPEPIYEAGFKSGWDKRSEIARAALTTKGEPS